MSEKRSNLYLSIQGKNNCIGIGKEVVKQLGVPDYITFREKDNYDSIFITPCKKEDVMSFKVPETFLQPRTGRKNFRLNSKAYVNNLLTTLGLDPLGTHIFYGTYSSQHNAVIFKIRGNDGERTMTV